MFGRSDISLLDRIVISDESYGDMTEVISFHYGTVVVVNVW